MPLYPRSTVSELVDIAVMCICSSSTRIVSWIDNSAADVTATVVVSVVDTAPSRSVIFFWLDGIPFHVPPSVDVDMTWLFPCIARATNLFL